jgi:RND superfamily putative drug exporter
LFERLGRYVVAHPWRVIAAWVIAAAIIVPFAPSLSSVSSSDQASFLPSSYESVRAEKLVQKAFPGTAGASAIFIVERGDGHRLTPNDRRGIGTLAARLQGSKIESVARVSTGLRLSSPNGKAQLVDVAFGGSAQDSSVQRAVGTLRTNANSILRGGTLRAGLTGDAAIQVDSSNSFGSAQRVVFIATIVLILAMLLAVFRSPIAAIFPLASIGLVYVLTTKALAALAQAIGFRLDESTSSLLIVVLFGIGTDYILFLLFRYRERLGKRDDSATAIRYSVHKVGTAIASSGLVVMAAMLALVLSDLGSFRNMAPGFLLSVGTMLVASLTLVPAVMTLLGPRVFWPSKRWRRERHGRVYPALGRLISHRPAAAALVSGALLVGLASGVIYFKASYDVTSSLPSNTKSAQAISSLDKAFPPGSLNPTQILVSSKQRISKSDLAPIAARVKRVKGVASVVTAGFSPDGRTAELDVNVLANPSSQAAMSLVAGPVREAAQSAASAGQSILIGGESMSLADVSHATTRDYTIVYPFAAALILLILAVVLRSVIAPLYLLVGVGLGYTATLGASVHVFQGLQGHSGLLFMMPILVYLFVVAVGTDYNILLTTRLREEIVAGASPRRAAALAVEHAGPTVASAGIILAGTFGSLMLTGVSLLSEIGFAVASGIVLVAIVMASIFVPSVATLLGRFIWWPGHQPGHHLRDKAKQLVEGALHPPKLDDKPAAP